MWREPPVLSLREVIKMLMRRWGILQGKEGNRGLEWQAVSGLQEAEDHLQP